MAGIQDWFPYPVTQSYGVPNAAEPGGWHHGVDLGMPGGTEVLAPMPGTYDPGASGAYQVAEDVPGHGELIYMHIANALLGQSAGPITPHEDLGPVLSVNPQTGESFGMTPNYSDPATGFSYTETGPHLHLEAHTVAGAQAGSSEGIEDPANLFAGLMSGLGPGSSAYPPATAPQPASSGQAGDTTTVTPAAPGTSKSTSGPPQAGGCQHSILGLCLDDAATWGRRASIAAVLVISGLLLITLGIRHETYGLAAGAARAAA